MRRSLAFCSLLVAVSAAGCGLTTPVTSSDTRLVVTRNFGVRSVIAEEHPRVVGSDRVLAMLRRNAKIVVDAAGSIRSVNGATASWSVFVNGVKPDDPPAKAKLDAGDLVWLDGTDASSPPAAVVGSFPEPFRHGPEGKRLPVRVECSPIDSQACADVENRMTQAGVLAARGGVAQSFTKETLRILVGPYIQLRGDNAVRQLEQGPRTSGVYAQPSPDGKTIAVLNSRGATVQTLGPGSGLIAATRIGNEQPVWVVTGTDLAGVNAAVQSFDEGDLLNRYAVAVSDDRAISLPK